MSAATLSFFRVPFAWNILSSPSLSLSMCAGKDGRQEEKGMTQDEIAVWHEFEQTPGDSGGQRSLVCCSPWGHKELDTTERLDCKSCSGEC